MYWYRTWELIQVRSLGRLNGQRDSAVLHYSGRGNELLLHPTQKPEELISYLISKVVANLILDPFMGSGTTLRAAKNLGRKAIGIEIEERYAEIAARRMQQSVLPLEYENKGRTLEGLGSKKSSADNSPMFNL
jgi:DNA modification methylase